VAPGPGAVDHPRPGPGRPITLAPARVGVTPAPAGERPITLAQGGVGVTLAQARVGVTLAPGWWGP